MDQANALGTISMLSPAYNFGDAIGGIEGVGADEAIKIDSFFHLGDDVVIVFKWFWLFFGIGRMSIHGDIFIILE